ncbi:MAG: hypothetical protein ABIH90_02810 [Candidatus Aenigmatarchaeota archaeon]
MEKGKTTLRSVINELVDRANTDTRRLRVLEEKAEDLDTRFSSLKDMLLQEKKHSAANVTDITAALKSQEIRLVKMEKTLENIVKQFKNVVTTSKIKELETLVEMYNPLTSEFVTRDELEKTLCKRR